MTFCQPCSNCAFRESNEGQISQPKYKAKINDVKTVSDNLVKWLYEVIKHWGLFIIDIENWKR